MHPHELHQQNKNTYNKGHQKYAQEILENIYIYFFDNTHSLFASQVIVRKGKWHKAAYRIENVCLLFTV